MARKLFVSIENDDEALDIQTEETVTVAENDAEAAVATINETIEDIKEDIETLENAADDIETLEDHTEVVEGTLEDGGEGMTEDHAKTLEIAVEHICKKLNYKPKSKKIYSIEDFGSIHTRKKVSLITLETFKETISQLWERVVAFVKDVWEKVIKFYESYFSELGRLKGGIAALEKQVKEVKGSPKEKTLKAAGLTKAFWDFIAKDVKPKEILANHIAVTKAGLEFANGVAPLAEEVLNVVKKGVSGEELEVNSEMLGGVVEKSNSLLKSLAAGKDQAGPFFNGARFKLSAAAGGGKEEGVAGIGLGFQVDYVPFSTDKGAPALDKAGCEKVLGEAKELLSLTEKFKEKQAKIKAFQSAMVKIGETVISAVNKMSDSDDKAKKASMTEVRSFIQKSNTTYTRVLSTIPGLNTNVIKASMNYVQASLRNMGEAAATPAEG